MRKPETLCRRAINETQVQPMLFAKHAYFVSRPDIPIKGIDRKRAMRLVNQPCRKSAVVESRHIFSEPCRKLSLKVQFFGKRYCYLHVVPRLKIVFGLRILGSDGERENGRHRDHQQTSCTVFHTYHE